MAMLKKEQNKSLSNALDLCGDSLEEGLYDVRARVRANSRPSNLLMMNSTLLT
jgi:hypothetical protein